MTDPEIEIEKGVTEERIEILNDTEEGMDLLEDLDIPVGGITTIGEIKKALRLYLRDQIRKTFKCEKCDLKESDIEGVEDILGARYLLEQHHIEADDVGSMEDARALLETHFQDKLRLEPYDLDEVAEVVHKLMNENTQGRLKLLSKYNRVKEFLPRMFNVRRDDMKHQLPNLDKDMEYVHEMINKDNCTIMIAGETGAGKTCLLNLLLGELASELLPVSNLPQTSAICEIKYGETAMLKTCPVNKSTEAECIELEAASAAETIAGYVSERDCRVLKYSKVEVYWPCDWIKHGITITDTPGVGESSEFTQVVKDYIPKASGFIYVINTPNAGGINAEELGELLFYHITSEGISDLPVGQQHEEIKFDPRSAIFVCNKWDQVKPEEREEVKNFVKTSLQKVWRGFDFENQVFFISVQEIVREIQNGYVPKEYRRLLAGIQNLLPIGFKSRMEKQFWKMYNIVDRSIWILNNYIRCDHHRGRQEKKDQYRKALARLDDLDKRPKQARSEMNVILNKEVRCALSRIRDHLNSTEVREKLTEWKDSECPDNENLDRLLKLQLSEANKRILKEIHEFEEQQQIFENIQKKLISNFETIFVSVDNELQNIESSMKEDPDSRALLTPYYETQTLDPSEKKRRNVFKGKGQIWAPLGVLIGAFTLPFLSPKAKKINRRVYEYRTDKPTEMARITTEQVEELTSMTNNKLKQVIEDKLRLIKRKFDLLLDRIPDLIKANRILLRQLEKEIDTATSFGDYIPLVKEGEKIKDILNYDYLNYVRSYDIDFAKLHITNEIGKGMFAVVYRGCYQSSDDKVTTVAVKRLLKPITEDNSTEFIMEEFNIKRLQSPYVVQYLGTAVKRMGRKIYPAMILEFCEFTLDSILFSTGTYKGPGKVCESDSERPVLLERAARYADEISKGITAIHQLGIVHRDIKPDNILLDVDGHLKICDLGLAIRERDIMGEMAGAKVYMAPEILEARPYDRSVDLFSFGMISWEIWYGESIDTKYDGDNYEAFMKKPFPEHEPVSQWKEVFVKCCSLNSKDRLRADQCSAVFSALYAIQDDDVVLKTMQGMSLN